MYMYNYSYRTVALNGASSNDHNLNSIGPASTFLCFSESLERDLSNDIIKSKILLEP